MYTGGILTGIQGEYLQVYMGNIYRYTGGILQVYRGHIYRYTGGILQVYRGHYS